MTLILISGFFCILLLMAASAGMLFLKAEGHRGLAIEITWFVVFVVAFVLFRYPFLRSNLQLNPDEGQVLAQAVRFSTDWMPWRSVDGTTSGPFNSYIQAWPLLFGMFPDYRTARATSAILVIASVFFLHVGLRRVLCPASSLIILNACALFFCLATERELVHSSSEHLPMALCALIFTLSVWAARTNSPGLYFGVGLLLGCLPFTKLQVAPIAVAFVAVIVTFLIFHRGVADKHRRILFASLGAGLLSMPAMVLVPVIVAGCWRDFVIRYIIFAINYKPATPANPLVNLAELLYYGGSATAFLFSVVLGLGLVVEMAIRRVGGKGAWGGLAAALTIAAGAGFAVLKPNQPWLHYLLLLVVPAILLLASCWQLAMPAMSRDPRTKHRVATLLAVALVMPQLLVYAARRVPHHYLKQMYSESAPADPVVDFIRAHQTEGEALEVWGWMPSYYVLSRSRSATRDVIGHAMLQRNAHSRYYLDAHLSDLEKSRPKLFVDAVGAFHLADWPPDSEIRAEVVAPVDEWLLSNYTKVAEYPLKAPADPVRIYMRKDMAAELRKP